MGVADLCRSRRKLWILVDGGGEPADGYLGRTKGVTAREEETKS